MTWLPDRKPELKPLVSAGTPELSLLAEAPPTQLACALPTMPTALPQMSIGAWITELIWLPEPTPELPSDRLPASRTCDDSVLWLFFALCACTCGAVILWPSSWPQLPPLPPLPPPIEADEPPKHAACALPKMPTALPQTSIGAWMVALIWLPEPMPELPTLTLCDEPAPPPSDAHEPPKHSAWALPARPIALPQMSTGAWMVG